MYRPAPQPTHFSIPQPAVSEHAAASLCLPCGHAVHAPALALPLPLPLPLAPLLLLYIDMWLLPLPPLPPLPLPPPSPPRPAAEK